MKKRRPGRPSVDTDAAIVRVGVTLPAKQYDALCRQALREDLSVPEVIRRELRPNKNAKTLTR
jgi:hypothetical protein